MKYDLGEKAYDLLRERYQEFLSEELAKLERADESSQDAFDWVKIWRTYLVGLGCVEFVWDEHAGPFSHPEGFVVMLNPMSMSGSQPGQAWREAIAMPEEIVIRALALGEFPKESSA